MAREALKPLPDSPPQRRRTALIGGELGSQITRWTLLVVGVVSLVLFVLFPLVPFVAAAVAWGYRRRQWSRLFRTVLLVASLTLIAVTFPSWSAYLLRYVEALADAISQRSGFVDVYFDTLRGYGWGHLPLGAAFGVPLGWGLAWWDWYRTPPWREKPKAKTIVQHLMQQMTIRRIAAGKEAGHQEVVYGVETGRGDSGQPVTQRIVDMLHTLILGKTGRGKTQTMLRIIEAYIAAELPAFVVDMKGSRKTRNTIRAKAEAHGRPVFEFSLNGPMHMDPLHSDGTDPTRQKDLIISAEEWSDAHYKGVAEEYLLTMFKIIEVTGPMPGMSVLATVARLLNPNELSQFVNRNLRETSHDALRTEALAKADKLRENPTSVSGLAAKLERLANSIVGQWLAPQAPQFTLREAYDRGAVVIVSLNHMNYEQLSATVAAFIMQDLKSLAGDIQDLPSEQQHPWLMCVDEFTKIGSDVVSSTMEQVREAGARVLLSSQGVGGIAEKGEAFLSTVWGQADTIIAHGCDDDTAQKFSQEADTKWGHRQSHDTNERDAVMDLDRGGLQNRGRIDDIEVPRVTASKIKSQPTGVCSIIGPFVMEADEDDVWWKRLLGRPVVKRALVTDCRVVMSNTARENDLVKDVPTVEAGELEQAASDGDLVTASAPVPAAPQERSAASSESVSAASDGAGVTTEQASPTQEPEPARPIPGNPGRVHGAGITSGAQSPSGRPGRPSRESSYFDDWWED